MQESKQQVPQITSGFFHNLWDLASKMQEANQELKFT